MASRIRTGVRSWLLVGALAAPLLAICVWLARGALAPPPAVDAATSALASPSRPVPPASEWPPALDLPALRLEERVNGGADALRAAGCMRLLYWRSETPAAEIEALAFDSVEHARAAFSREAGDERTAGPGDEAQVSEQAVYFRRGAVLVRAFADPGAGSAATLAELARRVEPQLPGLR